MNSSKFIVYPHNLDGLNKRGVLQQRKDQNTNIVQKKIKNPTGQSSSIGWGVVDSTLITVQKDLDTSEAKQKMLISQLCTDNYLEREPIHKKMKSYDKPITSLPVSSSSSSSSQPVKTTPLIEEWYQYCENNLEKGTIGLVPDCFQNQLPPLSELMCTNIGKCLMNFSRFTKNKF
jgi:hypothetical protein